MGRYIYLKSNEIYNDSCLLDLLLRLFITRVDNSSTKLLLSSLFTYETPSVVSS